MNSKSVLAAVTIASSPTMVSSQKTARTMSKNPHLLKDVVSKDSSKLVSDTARNDMLKNPQEIVDPVGNRWQVEVSSKSTKATSPQAQQIAKASIQELEINATNMRKIQNGTLPAGTKGIKIGGVTHYAYRDCLPANRIMLEGRPVHKAIKEAYLAMKAAAKKDGINLNIISGFRATERQKTIFPKKWGGASNIPSEAKFKSRLKESAPPGFSEHHTGYAIDMCSVEEADFMRGGKFEKEGKWLKEHANEFGFEQSFPENNSQGLICEPWHYRYIGDATAQRTFEAARANM